MTDFIPACADPSPAERSTPAPAPCACLATHELDDALASAMHRAGHAWREAIGHALAELPLTQLQWVVLEQVREHPGLSQAELAGAVGIEAASLVRVLDGLQRQGWVERRADGQDRRVNRVYLAASACPRMARAHALVDALQRQAVSSMSAADRTRLGQLLLTMAHALQHRHPGDQRATGYTADAPG